jgi:glutathione peroxidase-family protein
MMFSCGKKTEFFNLDGKLSNVKNGTVLYLWDSEQNVVLDSTQIQNNTFRFETKLPYSPIFVTLKSLDSSLEKGLWLENTPMQMDARKTTFSDAEITGSNTEIKYNALLNAVDTLSRKEGKLYWMKFVGDNQDDILGSYVLSTSFISWKKKKTDSLYQLLSEKNKNSVYGKKIRWYLELSKEPKIGESFADFAMVDINGKQQQLSDFKGKITLLEFWASTCAPCREYNPELVKIYEKYNSHDFEIFAVSLDTSKESWLKAIEKDKLKWIHLSDLRGWLSEPAIIYGISAIPNNFLIDSNGTIIARDISVKELDQVLNEKINVKMQ